MWTEKKQVLIWQSGKQLYILRPARVQNQPVTCVVLSPTLCPPFTSISTVSLSLSLINEGTKYPKSNHLKIVRSWIKNIQVMKNRDPCSLDVFSRHRCTKNSQGRRTQVMCVEGLRPHTCSQIKWAEDVLNKKSFEVFSCINLNTFDSFCLVCCRCWWANNITLPKSEYYFIHKCPKLNSLQSVYGNIFLWAKKYFLCTQSKWKDDLISVISTHAVKHSTLSGLNFFHIINFFIHNLKVFKFGFPCICNFVISAELKITFKFLFFRV